MQRLISVVALMAAAATPAWAQPADVAPERITAGWVFTPAIGFGTAWDSNPTTQNNASPIGSELVAVVSPLASLSFHGRRAHVTSSYSGTLERFQELAELTRYAQRASFDSRYQMTPRLAFETRTGMTSTPTTDGLEIEGVPFVRVGSQMVNSLGGFEFKLSPRSLLKTNYGFQWVHFDRGDEGGADFRFLQGGHAHTPSAEFEYAVTSRIKTGALYTYRHMVIDAGEEIFGSHRAQALLSVQVLRHTSVYGRAGYDYLALRDTSETRSGPSYGAGINQRIREISINGSYERSFMPSFGFGSLMASNTLRASVTVPFGRLYAGGSFSYRRTDPVVLQDVLVQLDSYWTNANVGYYVARWLRVEGFLSVNQQVSDARGDVDRTRVGIQFVTLKPMRIQ